MLKKFYAKCIQSDPLGRLIVGQVYECEAWQGKTLIHGACIMDSKTFWEHFEPMYCRTCKHRKRFPLNEYSNKVVQCCDLQPSNRSNSGYKTIKVTDVACGFYEPKKGGEK